MRESTSPPDPALWVDRIVALRRDGRDDEADRELERLRARYPDFSIPPAARRTRPSVP